MSMNESIRAAIKDNLSESVSKELQSYLSELESDREELRREQKENLKLTEELADLKDREVAWGRCEEAEEVNATRHAELEKREALLELREKHAEERVDEIRNLTSTVFQSNRIGYNLNLSAPNPRYGMRDDTGNVDYCQSVPMRGELDKKD